MFLTDADRNFLLRLTDLILNGSDNVVNGDYRRAATRRFNVSEVLNTLRLLTNSERSTLVCRLNGLRACSVDNALEDVYLLSDLLMAASRVYRVDDVRLVALLSR